MSRSDTEARTGVVEAPTLSQALQVVSKRGFPRAGDTLAIGLPGFPPASYECVTCALGPLSWRLVNRLAA